MLFLYGIRASHLKSFVLSDKTCACSSESDTVHMHLYGRYAHVFWIPAFPAGIRARVSCQRCGAVIEEKDFGEALQHRCAELKKQVRVPVWHFTLLAIGAIAYAREVILTGRL